MLRALLAASTALVVVGAAHAEPVTLQIIPQGQSDSYQAVVDAFEAAQPDIKVVIQTPAPTYEELLQRTVRGAIVDNPPDVAFQGYNLMRQVVSLDAAIDLTPFMSADTSLADEGFDPALASSCTADGVVAGLPFAMSLPMLYLNVDLVRAAGGDPDHFPATWDGVVDLAEKIHALDGNPQGIHFRYAHSGNWSFQALITSQGGRFMGEDDKTLALSGPERQKALQLLQEFAERGGMVDMTSNQARQAFSAGTIGIFQDSSAFLTSVEESTKGQFELRTVPYPLAENGRLPPGGNCITIVTQDPARQQAAWEFVTFAVGPVGQSIFAKATGYVPTNRRTVEDPALLGDLFAQDPNRRATLGLLSRLTEWYGFPADVGAQITTAIEARLQSVVARTATADEAMEGMVADVQGLLGSN